MMEPSVWAIAVLSIRWADVMGDADAASLMFEQMCRVPADVIFGDLTIVNPESQGSCSTILWNSLTLQEMRLLLTSVRPGHVVRWSKDTGTLHFRLAIVYVRCQKPFDPAFFRGFRYAKPTWNMTSGLL